MKKLISCLLLMAMLVTALAACGEKGGETGSTTPNNSQDDASTQQLDEYGRPLISNTILEEGIRFDDKEISILYADQNQVYDSDLVGEKVNDANFSRDISVENALGVTMDWIYTDFGSQAKTYNNLVIKSISGGKAYNILMAHSYYSANLAIQGYFQNVYDLKYVDYSQPWWTEKVMDEITVNGVSYFASGDMVTSGCASTTCLFYNKDLFVAKYSDINIYDEVFNYKWTMERFAEMVREVYVDNDGVDGTSQGDFLGLATSPSSAQADPFLYGLGVRLTRVNSEGTLEISLGDEWSVNSFSETYKLFQQNEGVYHKNIPTEYEWTYEKFVSSQALFLADNFGSAVTYLSNMDAHYGVLPIPMLNESQGEYLSGGIGGLIAIPTNATELDATAATLDLLNYYGYQYVVPMYFEKMLKTQYADAPEDARVYELLHDSKWADFGIVYSFAMGDPFWTWRKQLREASNNISGHWSSNMSIYTEGLTTIMNAFRTLA